MKIAQLEYFCAATRLQSITRAAEELYVTQPAISSAIKELEKEFNVKLFIRNKNHLYLTQEGEAFYQKAQDLLEHYKQTKELFSDLGQNVHAIKIGIPPLLSTIFFPKMLIDFREKYPNIPIELYEYGSLRATTLTQEGVLDLAIVNASFYHKSKVNVLPIMNDHIVFCVSRHHRFAKEKSITLNQLIDEPMILFNTDSVLNKILQAEFDKAKARPNIILQASQLYTIKNFIKENLGGAFLYSSLIQNDPNIVGIPITPIITQEIGLIWRKDNYVSSNAEKFIQFIKKPSR